MRYVGYFNDNKIRYYFGSLQEKGCIMVSDILAGNKRYQITLRGIEIINGIEDCYQRSLDKFIIDNSIIVP
jgi:hypothetical protein